MALVLCTGVDRVLLEKRKLSLEQAGHTVISATNQPQLISACQQYKFAVAVIGQAVSANSKRLIASLVRLHCPSAKILELYSPHEAKAVESADSWSPTPEEVPSQLAERVTELAQPQKRARTKARTKSNGSRG
jgi:hypothetical protein